MKGGAVVFRFLVLYSIFAHMFVPVHGLSASHKKAILFLSDIYFGKHFLTQQLFELENFYITYKIIDNELVAFSVVSLNSKKEIATETGIQLGDFMEDAEKVAFRRHTVVHDRYRKKGIAKTFIAESIDYFKEHASYMFATVWQQFEVNTMDKLFDKFEFKNQGLIPAFWANDSVNRNYICNACQQIPCKCAASIRVRLL